MADLALVVQAGVLGAVVLAVVLLHQGQKRNRQIITQLNAELAAQKIAALTQRGPTPLPAQEPEPARRKRHLALHIGGGLAAFLASLGSRASNAWTNHRAATVTVTTAAASVAVAGAFVFTGTSDATPTTVTPSATQPSHPSEPLDTADTDDETPELEAANFRPITEAESATAEDTSPALSLPSSPQASSPATEPTPGTSAETPSGQDEETGIGAPPAPPGETTTPAPSPSGHLPTPWPTEDSQAQPSKTPDLCDGLGAKLPPVLELCLR
ncbi:hypothetical protein ACGFR8_07555 [Streptomyces brevispora]|uniref:hypothetical protein n=1 Tax=Streptomyces brevispora TaxID=887462 RepID=UPI003722D05B